MREATLKHCPYCKMEFKPAAGFQKYCNGICRQLYHDARLKRIRQEKRQKQEQCGVNLHQWESDARAAGMTYGQYTAMLEMRKQERKRKKK